MTTQIIYDAKDGTTSIVNLTADEIESRKTTSAENWAFLREQRDFKLTETDWWAVSDRSMTSAQTKYRQDLRDLPANTSDPTNPTWPTKP
tara:strand:- start:229 stop:498 length:270 start_codon:yes stop_codon:yes gene_type:complete